MEQSWQHYIKTDAQGYDTGGFGINPRSSDGPQSIPMLETCKAPTTPFARRVNAEFPCICGDTFGSESKHFWASTHMHEAPLAGRIIRTCLKAMEHALVDVQHPGVFTYNMCQLYFSAIHTDPQKHNDHHFREDQAFCQEIVDTVDKIRQRNGLGRKDDVINHAVCEIRSPGKIPQAPWLQEEQQ